jgi:hypothetical protein
MAPCGREIRDQIVDARRVDRAILQRIEPTKGVVRGNFSNAIKVEEASRKELGKGLVNKILKDLGLK